MAKFLSFKNKVVVITGGIKNLGGLSAQAFIKQGAKVVIHYHSITDQPLADQLLAKIQSLNGKAVLYQADLKSADDLKNLFDFAEKTYGKIDIAINTIGKVLRKPIADTTEKEFDQMDNVNNKIAYFFIKEAEKHMNDNGKIISITTSLLAAYTDGYSTYAGNKAPLEHYTRAASKEFMARGISVNTIAPGPMDTPFFYGQETPERVAFHKSQALGNNLTKVEDIVPIILFLTGDGGWITGQTIFANGGYTTR
jgi:NAD(P)-dependent dehydrogenase (short-subunit alcohol dehydrogenase family)